MKKIRCAIYTRKSSEEGLDQDFNSLDAQREACAAYVASQKHEGWVLLPEYYDDGGISGGTMERPALQRLLNDIDEGLVDQIIVYKIDRLTRSLSGFAKLVDQLDAAEASFVSVTQSFNTSTSMGRLTLNVLLSFAQFEREVTAERIRDKISASKKKGLWMGGSVPIGFEADGRSLKLNVEEAETIRTIYALYQKHGNIRLVKDKVDKLGLRSRKRLIDKKPLSDIDARKQPSNLDKTPMLIGDVPFSKGHIHFILTNPIYAGRIRHKDIIYDGQHPYIIEPEVWDGIQTLLQLDARKSRTKKTGLVDQSKLLGKIFDESGARLTPSHSKKGKRRYRYYISHHLTTETSVRSEQSGLIVEQTNRANWRLPAKPLEDMIQTVIVDYLIEDQQQLLTSDASSEQIRTFSEVIQSIANKDDRSRHLNVDYFELIERIDLKTGIISIKLNSEEVSKQLSINPELLNESTLSFDTPFQYRKRGVETKFIIRDKSNNHDEVLVRNLAQAHHFMDMIKSGNSIEQIARSYSATSKVPVTPRRVSLLLKLACLAPDITNAILQGRQPHDLTTAKLLKSPLSYSWDEQRVMVDRLS
jgi:DNA invertase Pin-like site-specific DNA recombinase